MIQAIARYPMLADRKETSMPIQIISTVYALALSFLSHPRAAAAAIAAVALVASFLLGPESASAGWNPIGGRGGR